MLLMFRSEFVKSASMKVVGMVVLDILDISSNKLVLVIVCVFEGVIVGAGAYSGAGAVGELGGCSVIEEAQNLLIVIIILRVGIGQYGKTHLR